MAHNQQGKEVKNNYVNPIYRDQVLWITIDEITKTGRLITLAEMKKIDPQKDGSDEEVIVDPLSRDRIN